MKKNNKLTQQNITEDEKVAHIVFFKSLLNSDLEYFYDQKKNVHHNYPWPTTIFGSSISDMWVMCNGEKKYKYSYAYKCICQ